MKKVWSLLQHEWMQPGLLYAFVTGLCLGVGFILPTLWWLAILGISSVLRVATLPIRTISFVRLVMFAWFLKYACALSWYLTVYPITWIVGLPLWVQVVVIGAYWLTSALWLAVGGAVCAYVMIRLYHTRSMPLFVWYMLVPFLWLAGELAGALFFSLVTDGPGSFIQTYFSFGMIGYLLAETNLGLQLAGVYGVWGLSFCIVALSTFVCALRNVPPTRKVLAAAVLMSIFGAVPYFESSVMNTPKGVTVISVDTTFDENEVTTYAGVKKRITLLDAAVEAAIAAQPTYILLPEDSRFVTTKYGDVSARSALSQFLFTHGNTSSILIDSGRVDMLNGDTYLRATIFNGKENQVYQFDKQYLVPQGEYVPYLYAGALRLLGFGQMVDSFEKDSSYRPGPLTRSNVTTPANIPGVLFCSESVRPGGVTSMGTVPFVVHPLSHGWFHHPTVLWHQLDQILRIHARVSGVPVVSAGNLVSGKLYLPNGEIQLGEIVGTGDGWLLRKFSF